jgi:hypothetical protein
MSHIFKSSIVEDLGEFSLLLETRLMALGSSVSGSQDHLDSCYPFILASLPMLEVMKYADCSSSSTLNWSSCVEFVMTDPHCSWHGFLLGSMSS